MTTIFVGGLSDKEKKKLDVAKARSDSNSWRDLFLTWSEEIQELKEENSQLKRFVEDVSDTQTYNEWKQEENKYE